MTYGIFGKQAAGAVVPIDFGVDLTQESLPVTDEMIMEARRLEAENASASSSATGMGSSKTLLVLAAVGLGVWLLTPGKKKVQPNRRRCCSRNASGNLRPVLAFTGKNWRSSPYSKWFPAMVTKGDFALAEVRGYRKFRGVEYLVAYDTKQRVFLATQSPSMPSWSR